MTCLRNGAVMIFAGKLDGLCTLHARTAAAPGMVRCTGCCRELAPDAFQVDARRRSGRQAACKACRAAARRATRATPGQAAALRAREAAADAALAAYERARTPDDRARLAEITAPAMARAGRTWSPSA